MPAKSPPRTTLLSYTAAPPVKVAVLVLADPDAAVVWPEAACVGVTTTTLVYVLPPEVYVVGRVTGGGTTLP